MNRYSLAISQSCQDKVETFFFAYLMPSYIYQAWCAISKRSDFNLWTIVKNFSSNIDTKSLMISFWVKQTIKYRRVTVLNIFIQCSFHFQHQQKGKFTVLNILHLMFLSVIQQWIISNLLNTKERKVVRMHNKRDPMY